MIQRSIKALLFSDVKSFSRFSERECLAFCRQFHSGVQRDVLANYDNDILVKNTWGDALHIVLDDLNAAGHLALDLRDWMDGHDWSSGGLSIPPRIRISLHAGVVSKVADPIISGFNYIGCNTNKAARIEPITYEGQVFVSGTFAALLAADPKSDLSCDYVGMKELPKGAGMLGVYLLRRK